MSTSQTDLAFSRRFFFAASAGGVAGLTLTSQTVRAATRDVGSMPGIPYQDPKLVRDVVRRSHFDVDGVRDLVTERPELAKAAWDWGFG
ncbi:MAG: hypothetical protein O7G85_05170, partial [Planctomycetota bacterium]|nr:hypothetical protein [Planctomycetota bacterium]